MYASGVYRVCGTSVCWERVACPSTNAIERVSVQLGCQRHAQINVILIHLDGYMEHS